MTQFSAVSPQRSVLSFQRVPSVQSEILRRFAPQNDIFRDPQEEGAVTILAALILLCAAAGGLVQPLLRNILFDRRRNKAADSALFRRRSKSILRRSGHFA